MNMYVCMTFSSFRALPKRATAVVFAGDDQHVLVADKTGEVWQYSQSDSALPGTHLLGHFSMLLDMVRTSALALSISIHTSIL